MHMVDGGEGDEKIIGVPVEDPRFNDMQDLEDLNKHTLKEIEHFFLTYKKLQNKIVEVNGFGTATEAKAAITEGLSLYGDKFPK